MEEACFEKIQTRQGITRKIVRRARYSYECGNLQGEENNKGEMNLYKLVSSRKKLVLRLKKQAQYSNYQKEQNDRTADTRYSKQTGISRNYSLDLVNRSGIIRSCCRRI